MLVKNQVADVVTASQSEQLSTNDHEQMVPSSASQRTAHSTDSLSVNTEPGHPLPNSSDDHSTTC